MAFLMFTFIVNFILYMRNVYSYWVNDLSTVVLSVRVRKELKREAEELGIDIRSVVERALREEILKRKQKRMRELLEKALRNMDLSVDEWVRVVRESRRER